ncbi:hypothetical protein C8R45DRAFT_1089195 [Mycena sanguinolenta]|nr:hypothetical protein C8R45DRAFT_1089195 [Mycena sanguinolenta]
MSFCISSQAQAQIAPTHEHAVDAVTRTLNESPLPPSPHALALQIEFDESTTITSEEAHPWIPHHGPRAPPHVSPSAKGRGSRLLSYLLASSLFFTAAALLSYSMNIFELAIAENELVRPRRPPREVKENTKANSASPAEATRAYRDAPARGIKQCSVFARRLTSPFSSASRSDPRSLARDAKDAVPLVWYRARKDPRRRSPRPPGVRALVVMVVPALLPVLLLASLEWHRRIPDFSSRSLR